MKRLITAALGLALLASFLIFRASSGSAADTRPTINEQAPYEDGRPQAKWRLEAEDHGVVLRHGGDPQDCDEYGARDVWVYTANGKYYMHYDAAGPEGWLCALATSNELIHWQKHEPILPLGPPGSDDSKSASYGVTYFDGKTWHLFYLGTPNTTPRLIACRDSLISP